MTLTDAEVQRLRQAVGYRPDWSAPTKPGPRPRVPEPTPGTRPDSEACHARVAAHLADLGIDPVAHRLPDAVGHTIRDTLGITVRQLDRSLAVIRQRGEGRACRSCERVPTTAPLMARGLCRQRYHANHRDGTLGNWPPVGRPTTNRRLAS